MSIVQSKKDAKDLALYIHGNRCRVCGYDKCTSALEFHHVLKHSKEFSISKIPEDCTVKDFIEEMSKGIYLCCMCHREYHAGLLKLPDDIQLTTRQIRSMFKMNHVMSELNCRLISDTSPFYKLLYVKRY